MAVIDREREASERVEREALIREARERQRRRRRRGAMAIVGLLVLAGGGVAAFGGGGSPAGLTLHGPLPAGIAARAADPGGGLPWGIRVVRGNGGVTCVQLGRLRGGSLGVIGQDASFGNDGRFHPIPPSTVLAARCAPTDAADHAFLNIERAKQPASGSVLNGNDGPQPQQCRVSDLLATLPARLLARNKSLKRHVEQLQQQPICASGDLRFVQYGLLGPDATSITYMLAGHREIMQMHGPDGAYLVVGPQSPTLCDRVSGTNGCASGGEQNGPDIRAGLIVAIRYRNGRTCRPGSPSTRNSFLAQNPAIGASCPPIGYVAPKAARIDQSQVASPVSVRRISARRYCFRRGRVPSVTAPAPATDIGPYIPCDGPVPAGDVRANPEPTGGVNVAFTWTARQPVTSRNSQYQYFIDYPHNCGGQGGITRGTIRAGERMTRAEFVQTRCSGTFTGSVGYIQNLGPGGPDHAGTTPGHGGSLLVGRFTFTLH
jgi:hypothetical protein